jgi:hypothetical protein
VTGRSDVDGVLEAIDNALWDWTESPDAMTVRYGDGVGAPGISAAPPERHVADWLIVYGEDGPPDPYRGIRLVESPAVPPGQAYIGPIGADPTDWPGEWQNIGYATDGFSFGFDTGPAEDEPLLRSVGMYQFMSASWDNPRVSTVLLDEVDRAFQRAIRASLEAAFGPSLPEPDEPEPDEPEPTPRERALAARRNRNTGPARNPHRHRGI